MDLVMEIAPKVMIWKMLYLKENSISKEQTHWNENDKKIE